VLVSTFPSLNAADETTQQPPDFLDATLNFRVTLSLQILEFEREEKLRLDLVQ